MIPNKIQVLTPGHTCPCFRSGPPHPGTGAGPVSWWVWETGLGPGTLWADPGHFGNFLRVGTPFSEPTLLSFNMGEAALLLAPPENLHPSLQQMVTFKDVTSKPHGKTSLSPRQHRRTRPHGSSCLPAPAPHPASSSHSLELGFPVLHQKSCQVSLAKRTAEMQESEPPP